MLTLSRPVSKSLGRGLARPPLVAPVGVTLDSIISVIVSAAGTGDVTTPSFTPTTADALVLLGARKFGTTAYAGNTPVAVGGLAARNINLAAVAGAVGNPLVASYVVRGLTPGASVTAVWTGNGINNIQRFIFYIFCLSHWLGNIGAHSAVAVHQASSTAGAVVAVTPLVKRSSLMCGMAYGTDLSTEPFTASGFTGSNSTSCGTSPSSGASAFTKTGGAPGGTETLTPVAAAAWTDFGSLLVEVY